MTIKLTFGPMVQAGPGNGASMAIMRGAEQVGSIVAWHDDANGGGALRARRYVVGGYDVELWCVDGQDKAFPVPRGGKARAVLAEAKAYAVSVAHNQGVVE